MSDGSIRTGRVESLAYGAHGVVRIDGKVHFVRRVVPGDEIELAVREDRGTFAYSDLVAVREPGRARRDPPCDYLPRCGGCPWQHVDYAAQAEAKERAVRDLLARVGGIADPPVRPILRADREFGYRRRLGLRVEGKRLGFLAAASHDLVPVERCLLAAPELDGAIAIAARWIAELRTTIKRLEIAATGEGERFALVGQGEGRFAPADALATEAMRGREPRVAAAVLHGRGWRRVFGDDAVTVPLIDGDEMHLRAGGFSQVGDAGNALLIRTVIDLAVPTAGETFADLYAGAGNLGIPLARRGVRVLAVERTRASVEAARANARRLGLDVEFQAGDVPEVLDRWIGETRRLDAVVLDPPRNGAAEAVPRLSRLSPARIVYVSCNPATLARDVRSLAADYRLERVQPIDFFPQTYHVESVALLVRRATS